MAITLGGTVEFINNKAIEGAALLLQTYAQLILSDNLQLIFDGNVGRYFIIEHQSQHSHLLKHFCPPWLQAIIKYHSIEYQSL